MVFIFNADGSLIKCIAEPVYQNSQLANKVIFVAPIPSTVAVTVAFQLPNGVRTAVNLLTPNMASLGELNNVFDYKHIKYSAWQYQLPFAVTEYAGTVTAQFYAYSNGGVGQTIIQSTYSTTFTVQKGTPKILPETPTQTIYEQILALLSEQGSDITALEARVSQCEEDINNLESDLDEEATTRESADAQLQTNIDNEAITRANKDAELEEDIDDLDDRVTELEEGTGGEIAQRVATLESYVPSGTSSVNKLVNSATTNALESQLSTVSGNLDGLTDRVDGLEDNVEDVESELETLSDTVEQNTSAISDLSEYIPEGTDPATDPDANFLVNRALLNSSVQTATANFRGNWGNWNSVPNYESAYPIDGTGSRKPTTNDYLVVRDASGYSGVTAVWEPDDTLDLSDVSVTTTIREFMVNFRYNLGETGNKIIFLSPQNSVYTRIDFDNAGTYYSSSGWSGTKPAVIEFYDGVDILNEELLEFLGNNGNLVMTPVYEGTWRFKYVGNWDTNHKVGWIPEYQVNETPLTQAQLNALNSGIIASDVTNLRNAVTKLSGISSGATKTEQSSTNGNIKIDGVEKNVYTLPTATSNALGGVKPVAKTSAMTQPVGIDANGGLFTSVPEVPEITVDQTYNSSSTNPQSGTAVAGALSTIRQLPEATISDAGKFLRVNSSGNIVLETIPFYQGGELSV